MWAMKVVTELTAWWTKFPPPAGFWKTMMSRTAPISHKTHLGMRAPYLACLGG